MQKILSSAPHIRGNQSVQRIMLDVLIALLPACVAAVYFFGLNAFILILLCVGAAVGTEAAIQFFCRKPVTVADLSAAVTGVLLALNLPSGVPFYIPVVGSVFAIAIVKQCFGGLGNNFMNPALGARAFLLISWPVAMTTWFAPGGVDAVATATPLAVMANGGNMPSLWDMFIGNHAGCLGETSALALIAGGVYLLARQVITWRIPGSFIGIVALISLLTGDLANLPYYLMAGGVILGAFFMATDYVTSPVSPRAQIIFGLGCGGITMLIRLFGGYPEGVSFSILFMNLLSPLLDKAFTPRVFGEVSSK
jgi:electron transport complex protein RnfD